MKMMIDVKHILCLVFLMFGESESIERRRKDWYETTSIYQIYTISYKDFNGDGKGDLKGIHEKLDYIQSIGVETLWIQSILKSPFLDFGYDVSDYTEVDPMFGTTRDLKQLIDEIHDRGMRVIIDFIPNHTSNESEWFIKSVNREHPYEDFYIWRDPKDVDRLSERPFPPNNWLSVFGGSAWTWNDKRRQYYYRAFLPEQPDLNYRNPLVRSHMECVLRYWLDFGVDGFRVDAVHFLFEDECLRDNPWISPELENSTDFNSQRHIHNIDLQERFELMHEWRLILDEYKAKDGKTRILALDVFAKPKEIMEYFGNETYKIGHLPFYLKLVELDFQKNSSFLDNAVRGFIDAMTPTAVPNWMASTHNLPRVASRTDPPFCDAMMMIELLLPGVVGIYFGEEIGMEDTRIRQNQLKDRIFEWKSFTRDIARSPMQWDNSINAGFTTKKEPWLPVNANYWRNNVKQQLTDYRSHLNIFKRLMQLRKLPAIVDGALQTCIVSEWVYLFLRSLEGEPPIVVIVNMGSETESTCLDRCINNLPDTMEVHTSSANSGYDIGAKITIARTPASPCGCLRPKAGLVLTTIGNSPPSQGTSLAYSYSCLLLLLSLIFINTQSQGCQF